MDYDLKALVRTYLDVTAPDNPALYRREAYGAAARAYNELQLKALQRLFTVRLDGKGASGETERTLAHFRGTVRSYHATAAPWPLRGAGTDSYAAALQDCPPGRRREAEAAYRLSFAFEAFRAAHIDYMHATLARVVADRADAVFDSAALKRRGCDDSQRPNIEDHPFEYD